jgi:hypothetical protein
MARSSVAHTHSSIPRAGIPRAGIIVLIAAMFWLSGCSFFNRETEGSQQEPDILATLPQDWQVVDIGPVWTQVNVDGDSDIEFLLVYTYNNSGDEKYDGPAGANIYDLQNNTEQPDLREQPAPSYQPYRLLPNFWARSDTGFIAPPGAQEAISVREASRPAAEQSDALPANVTNAGELDEQQTRAALETYNREIIICGGATSITVAWWRNLLDGYGVANIYAAGGFDGVDCADLRTMPATLDGFDPLQDRSLLCRRLSYTRTLDPNGDGVRDIIYAPAERGIDFCRFAPVHAFYPEAVVMAYLDVLVDDVAAATRQWTTMESDNVASDNGEGRAGASEPAEWFAGLGDTQLLIGLHGPRTLPFRGTQEQHTATVCAELLSADGGLSAYTFRLRHYMPDYEDRRTDEWRISSILRVPAPPGGPAPDCVNIVPNGTPGRALIP